MHHTTALIARRHAARSHTTGRALPVLVQRMAIGLIGGLALTAHAGMAADLPVEEAHQTAEDAEVLLRSRFPALTRVTLHTEPDEA